MTRQLPLTLGLLGLALVLGGASYYATDVRQAERIQTLKDSRRVAALAVARVEDLLAQESVSVEAADAALSRWHGRYKFIPREMDTADIVEYLEALTRSGFEQFDLALTGRTTGPDFSTYQFSVEGMGTYPALYRLVWNLENNREFYRVNDLKMEHVLYSKEDERERDLVKFTFGLEIYYAGLEGISAPEEDLAPIPKGLLLPNTAPLDIFRPLVRVPRDAPSTPASAPSASEVAASPAPAPERAAERAPDAPAAGPAAPSRPDGLDLGRSTLSLILGDQAVFRDDWGREFRVGVGDEVEGGRIVLIDAQNAAVHAEVTRAGRQVLVVRTLGDRVGRQN